CGPWSPRASRGRPAAPECCTSARGSSPRRWWPCGGSAGSEAAVIQARGLEKVYGGRPVVRGLTFAVEPGEVLGLVGPNGAGKTTTLRMLATTLRPTRGTATVAGYDVVREPLLVRAHVGVLPTDPGLYGRLTAAENLRFYGHLCGLGGAALERRIDELLEWLG